MKNRIILILTILIVSISISNAKYYVLNDQNQVIGQCNDLKIEKDDSGAFSSSYIFTVC